MESTPAVDVESPRNPTEAAVSTLFWVWVSLDATGEALRRRDAVLDAWAGAACRNPGVRYLRDQWAAACDAADRQNWSRGLRILAREGLAHLETKNGRTRFIRLTPAGLAAARRIAKAIEVDLGADSLTNVLTAVQAAEWAEPKAGYLEVLQQ